MQSLSKLNWQCRRGTQELDRLLQNYLQKAYSQASVMEQQQFERLLTLQDNELQQLLLTESCANPEFTALIQKIQRLALCDR